MNLLFYGDDPEGATGYSIQARNILIRMAKHFNIAVIGINRLDENPQYPFRTDDRLPFKIYRANIENLRNDPCGYGLLMKVFPKMTADVLFVMGDIWNFKGWFAQWLEPLLFRKKFKVIGYFSTEYPLTPEEEYILQLIDFPITHSKWGFNYENNAGYHFIKEKIPKLKYIPDSVDSSIFYPFKEEQRMNDRLSVGWTENDFVIGCVNRNSERKDFFALLKVFKRVKMEIKNAKLYLHTSPYDKWMEDGNTVNLYAICKGLDLKIGQDVFFPPNFTPHHGYPLDVLNRMYNCMDLFVSTSVSEGFGVTPVEALFAGVPILIPGHTGFSNICETCNIDPVRSYTDLRPKIAYTPVHPIDEDDLVNRIIDVYEKKDKPSFRLEIDNQFQLARENFDSNVVFEKYWIPVIDSLKKRSFTRNKEILFVQHSSAGDIFLTLGCLKGIKERHQARLVYMTQKKYHKLAMLSPLVDEVIDYEPSKIHEYEFVYFPHEKFVLRGNWNANTVPLAQIYAKLCDVTWNLPNLNLTMPSIDLPVKYIVVHTTSHPYRTYPSFHYALEGCNIPVVQIGDKTDLPLGEGNFKYIDARGLSFAESIYIIKFAYGFVGIDSFPAHVAGTYNIPMVIVFGCGNYLATSPMTAGKIERIIPDYIKQCPILGPCSGNYPCPTPCGPRHHPIVIKKAIKKILPDIFPDVEKMLEKLLKMN